MLYVEARVRLSALGEALFFKGGGTGTLQVAVHLIGSHVGEAKNGSLNYCESRLFNESQRKSNQGRPCGHP